MKYQEKIKYFDLKNWRQNNKVTTREIGKICGVEYSYMNRLESGKHTASPKMAKKIFESLENWENKNSPTGVYYNFQDLLVNL